MSEHFDRGYLLYQQDRHALAERELRLAVAETPDDAFVRSVLALCLAEQGKVDDAEAEAQAAIGRAPEHAFAHYVLGTVYVKRRRPADAERAVREALRLDPSNVGAYSLLSAIRYDRHDWTGALTAAEDGLARDPNHTGCATSRTLALLQLGRTADADAATADALRREPDDAYAHTGRGWAMVYDGRPREALPHFREALRLDPTSEWARAGLIEALKARYWVYRQMLRFFLWMGRLSPTAQWGVILGLFFLQRVLGQVADQNPAARPFVMPVLAALVLFALLSWLAVPLFNLLLRLNKYGRFALDRDQRRQSHWVGGVIVVGLAAAVFWLVSPWGEVFGATTALTCVALLPAVASAFSLPAGWPRRVMALYAAGMVVAYGVMVWWFVDAIRAFDRGADEAGKASADAAWGVFPGILWAGVLSAVLANVLTMRR